jgi:hypothetical protein
LLTGGGDLHHVCDSMCVLEKDNDYHLCEMQSSLINDGTPLNDFDQTLLENKLTNGAQLTMRAGSVAPKNHVRLKIFRILDRTYQPVEASESF